MRSDGKRVKETAITSAIPYIMPHRYDAMNYVTEYADMETMRNYIRGKRKEGVRISYMSLILAAYHRAFLENPKINRFIMNKRIYQRSHFCVSFVILKTRADGTPDETTLKVYFEPDETVFTINDKIEKTIAQNSVAEHDNSTDKFANFLFSVPLLPDIVIGLARLLDRWNLLPKFIIDLSPFHTSLFITNLASINTAAIYHHCYEFGTTGVFLCMGRPMANYIDGDYREKLMPLKCVMDERICTGVDFARFWTSFNRYMKHPEMMETPKSEKVPAENETEETTA